MGKRDILDNFARRQGVEQIILAVTRRRRLTYDLMDLVQTVYLALLETKEEKIVQLDQRGELNFYAAGIVRRQFSQERSQFRKDVVNFQEKTTDLSDAPPDT